MVGDLIGDLIDGLIEADSAVCRVLVKAEVLKHVKELIKDEF